MFRPRAASDVKLKRDAHTSLARVGPCEYLVLYTGTATAKSCRVRTRTE